MTLNSATVNIGDTATASQHNNIRKDIAINAGDTLTDTGAANAYIVTVDSQITSLTTGQVVKLIITHTNTGNSTLEFKNGVALDTTKNIKLPDGSNPNPGDIYVGQVAVFMYDGTNFQLINPAHNLQGAVFTVTAGETIAVNEIVYFDNSSSKWKKADGNDTSKVRAAAIALTASTDTNPMLIQRTGIYTAPSGTPFTAGAQHYLSDTAGGVSTTPSTTTSVPIGFGLSTTQIVLTWGKKMARGTGTSKSAGGTNDETITVGFRAEHIILSGKVQADSAAHIEQGLLHYINGVFGGGFAYDDSQSIDSGNTPSGGLTRSAGGSASTLTINSTADTTFVIRTVNSGSAGGSSNINWIAFGE